MIDRQADWLKNDDEGVFFWHHIPKKNSKNIAIIILGPIGPEYMPCHRSIRLLADNLSQLGFHTIRYDPIGMGDSSGTLENKNIWLQWVKTPGYFADYFKNNYNINEIIPIGLRSGCLVLSEAIKKTPIKTAVFWHPITSGKTFIRGIQLLDSVLYKDITVTENKILEGGGYPFSKELQKEIKNINLVTQDHSSLNEALIINDADSTNNSRLHEKLMSLGIKSDSLNLNGLSDMTKQVTLSKIPHENINAITSWLGEKNKVQSEKQIETEKSEPKHEATNYNEATVNISVQRNIFGISTLPNKKNENIIVIFANTGAAHHAGPNRIHVDTSRILANSGIATLRIDLSNLGDSAESYEKDPPEEFPATAADDINTVINFIDKNTAYKKIILCGISAGAHNVFHAALEANCKNLVKIILINPETFYWSPNQTVFSSENTKTDIDKIYYRKQIYNYKKWLKLITNPQKIFNTSLFLFLFLYRKIKSISMKVLNLIGIKAKSRLERDITFLGKKHVAISLVHSKDDPGHQIILSQASKITKIHSSKNLYSSTQVNDADHTFSSINSRNNLYNALTRIMTETI